MLKQKYKKKIYYRLMRMRIERISMLLITGFLTALSAFITIIILCGATIKILPFSYAGITFTTAAIILITPLIVVRIILPVSSATYGSMARIVEQFYPAFDNSLINTVYLTDPKHSINRFFSQQLIEQLTVDTGERLKDIRTYSILPVKKFFTELSKCLILLLTLFLLNRSIPSFVTDALGSIIHPLDYLKKEQMKILNKNMQAYPAPKIGDIELTYIYPKYTKKPSISVAHTDGNISAYKGTQVIIMARADQDISFAALNIGKDMTTSMSIKDKRFIKGAVTVFEESIYSIEVKNSLGKKNISPIRHIINIIEDSYPEINLLFPEDMTEVKALDKVELLYQYGDDFGISDIRLVYEVIDKDGTKKKEGSISIDIPSKKNGKANYLWNLSLLKPDEGGQIRYSLKIADNDTVSGPKVASTEDYFLTIYDSEKGHSDIIFLQEKIFEDMLLVLADKLTNPLPEIKANTKLTRKAVINAIRKEEKTDRDLDKVLAEIDTLLSGLKGDPLADPATSITYRSIKRRIININAEKKEKFQWLENSIYSIGRKGIYFARTYKDREIDEIETSIIEFDRLIKVEKLNTLKLREEDLTDVTDSLYDLISNFSDMDKEDALRQFKEKIKKMERMFNEFMEKIMSMSKELPDEFINSEAFKDLSGRDVQKGMKDIMEALKDGDLDKAAELASSLMSEMEAIMQGLLDSFEGLNSNESFADIKEIDNAIETAEELLERENDLLKSSKTVEESISAGLRRAKDRLAAFRKKIENMSDTLQDKLAKLGIEAGREPAYHGITRNSLYKIGRDLNSMLRYLKPDLSISGIFSQQVLKDIKRYKDRIGKAMERGQDIKKGADLFEKAEEAGAVSEQIVSEFMKLFSKREKLTPAQRKQMNSMAKRQKNIQNDTMGLKKSLEGLEGIEAFLGSDIFHRVEDSISGMQNAGKGLTGGDINRSLGGEQDAVNNLSKIKSGLEGFKEGIKGMRKAYRGFKAGMGRTPGTGQGRIIRGKVDIPSEKEYQVPARFREEILKAMQGKGPEEYRDMNSRYYNELIK